MRHFRPVLAALLWAAPAPPALAHAILVGSDPASGATVAPGPAHIVLRFNSRIDQGRSRIEMRGGPQPAVLRQADPASPDQMAADVTLLPGHWVLRWQVLAVDGHLTRGDVPFTVAPPPPDATAPDAPPPDTKAP